MDVFTAASHHDVLLLIFRVALLLFTARALGEVAQRLGQPAVVGEILAGILLGPSLLSGFFPALGEWIVPQTELQGYLLEVVSLIGAMFLLLITGLETDLTLIRRHARTAIGVSLGGVSVTFFSGFLLGQLLPETLLSDPSRRLTFALFVGTAMSISAIPVIAKVMMDLNLMRRDIGQTIIAAGMSDDTIGWILLSVVAGLAAGAAVTAGSVMQAVGSVLLFMVASFTLGRWLVKRALDFVQTRAISQDAVLSLVVILMLAWGAVTQALNLEAVLGAFVMGILFGQMRRLRAEVHHRLESVALGIFAPVFFAVAGLKVNVLNLLTPRLLLTALAVIAVATIGKVVGTYLGARLIGRRDHWTALSFGAGLNARGAMEIIIATIGLRLGILSQDMFSIIVLMAMVTSLMAPTALRWVLGRVKPSDEELARLRQEELAEGSLVASIDRVLIPVRRRIDNSHAVYAIESAFLKRLGRDLSVTLLNVAAKGEKEKGQAFLDEIGKFFAGSDLSKRVVENDSVADAILNEASKEYDLIIMGAPERGNSPDVVFNPLIDSVMRLAPCPTMVVKGGLQTPAWTPQHLLVPTNGSLAAKAAAEVAFRLAKGTEAEVTILNVVERSSRLRTMDVSESVAERQLTTAYQMVDSLRVLGESSEVRVETEVRIWPNPAVVILEIAKNRGMDMILLGTSLVTGSEQLFLGPHVEMILDGAPCPVVIINTSSMPPTAPGASQAKELVA